MSKQHIQKIFAQTFGKSAGISLFVISEEQFKKTSE